MTQAVTRHPSPLALIPRSHGESCPLTPTYAHVDTHVCVCIHTANTLKDDTNVKKYVVSFRCDKSHMSYLSF